MGFAKNRGQAQVAMALGLLGIVTAAVAAATIIGSVASANSAVTEARAPAIPFDALLVIALLGVLLSVFIRIWRRD